MTFFTRPVPALFLWLFALSSVPLGAAAIFFAPDIGAPAFVFLALVVVFQAQLSLALIEANRTPDLFPASLFSACFEFVFLVLLALTWLGEIRIRGI
jgi:hypothetical protein